jgi:hypothetical protein
MDRGETGSSGSNGTWDGGSAGNARRWNTQRLSVADIIAFIGTERPFTIGTAAKPFSDGAAA